MLIQSANQTLLKLLKNHQNSAKHVLLIRSFSTSKFQNQKLSVSTSQHHHHGSGKLYRWNDVLFSSTFNEIVRLDGTGGTSLDPTQYSLFREKNFIKSFDKGFFSLMPFLVRSYERLVKLVDHEFQSIGCQKIIMPSMVGKHLWQKSERWDDSGEELFRVKDRHKNEFCLAPTQEEFVTQILSSCRQLSSRQLPIYLYQITPKFRDELRTKFGLLRAREFFMKDLYTFDKDEDSAKETYEKVCQIYEKIFSLLELPAIKTVGSVGSIGGKYSHEFLLETHLGEDELYTCLSCNESFNAELIGDYVEEQRNKKMAAAASATSGGGSTVDNQQSEQIDLDSTLHCLNCKSHNLMPKRNALELGHSFLLGDRYSAKMGAHFLTEGINQQRPLQMGCYGLGLSRILSGSVEHLSKKSESTIDISNTSSSSSSSSLSFLRWPRLLVPFKVCLLLPKKESKEDRGKGTEFSLHFARTVMERFGEDILLDDRSNLTIGKRLLTAKAIGVPFIVVAGRNIIDPVPKFELLSTYSSDPTEQSPLLLTQAELLNYLEQNLPKFS